MVLLRLVHRARDGSWAKTARKHQTENGGRLGILAAGFQSRIDCTRGRGETRRRGMAFSVSIGWVFAGVWIASRLCFQGFGESEAEGVGSDLPEKCLATFGLE